MAASVLALSVVASPLAVVVGEDGKIKVTENQADAALLDIELLSDTKLTNDGGTTATHRFDLNQNGSQEVIFDIEGKALANASAVVSGKKTAVITVPEELAGHVQANGEASIDSSITLRINEVQGIQTVITTTNTLLDAVASIIDNKVVGHLVKINVKEVRDNLNLLENLSEFGQGQFKAPITVTPDGRIVKAELNGGLGPIIAQSINRVLTDLQAAVNAINVDIALVPDTPILGPLNPRTVVNGLIDTLFAPAKLAAKGAIEVAKGGLTVGGALVNQLADAAVLGDTRVKLPTKINGDVAYLKNNPSLDAQFAGSVVHGNVLDLDILSGADGKSTLYYKGDTTALQPTLTLDPVTGDSTTGYEVKGTTTPNTTVTIKDSTGKTVGTTTSGADGSFTIAVDGSVGQEVTLTVTAKNDYGEKQGTVTTPKDQAVAPSAPTDVATTGNSTDGYEVTGKTEPGATVNVYDKDNNKVGTGTADNNGNFTVTVPGTVGPEQDLTVKGENSAGEGDSTTTKTPKDQAVAPSAPTDVATTGNSTSGYTVTGKAEPGATVNIYDKDNNKVGTGTTHTDGTFTVQVPGSVGQEADLTVKAQNNAGEGNGTTTKTPKDQAVAPSAPTDVATTGNSTDGYEVKGKAEPGATVNVYDKDNNKVGTGTADNNGNFTVTVPGTVGGEQDLTVKAQNDAGEGDGATTKTPKDSDTTGPEAPTDLKVTGNPDDGYTVTGKTEPGAEVVITDANGTEVGTGTADGDGNFSIDVPGTVGPDKDLTVTPTDKDGNKGDSGHVKTPPAEATDTGEISINGIEEFNYVITGTAPKATKKVKLIVNGHSLVTADVAADGTFTFDRKYVYDKDGNKKVLGAGDVIRVEHFGAGGEKIVAAETVVTAANLEITVQDIQVDPRNFDMTTITGTAGPNVNRVLLNVNGHDLQVATVTAEGKYSFERKYVYDNAGNKKLFGAGDIVKISAYDSGKQHYFVETTVSEAEVAPIEILNVDAENGVITGTTDKSVTKVMLSLNGQNLSVYEVADGAFTINRKYFKVGNELRKLKAGDEITVRNYEKLKSGSATFIVK